MASLKRWLDRRRNPWKGVFFDAFQKFRAENGQARLSHYEDLPAGAVVLDIGGFRGEWSDIVLSQQPDCTIHVFEPHPVFAENLRDKYKSDNRVQVHECALGAENGTLQLSDAGDASSAVAEHSRSFQAPVVPVSSFFEEHGLKDVALAKINIEGGEYTLLPALIEAGLMPCIARLQVQFHLFEPQLQLARETIIAGLSKSHSQVWCYTFVWEEWKRD
ncbi:FkbM family methyltransferase [Parasedimentitalea marina]|uniref:FkbM family methyltransferase n=1 Tax=Parasedimentitalea marina TaxID=2483033 RepID=A0A3T0N2C5_9RHOB|nr:FkbM family methyltransferase [Parasedimentitalea marina]AZV78164.1 FkbM family methyltransferase [Parasedimentitalea marina]